MDEQTNRRIDKQTNRQIDEQTNRRTDKQMNRQIDEQTNRRTDIQTNKQTNRLADSFLKTKMWRKKKNTDNRKNRYKVGSQKRRNNVEKANNSLTSL